MDLFGLGIDVKLKEKKKKRMPSPFFPLEKWCKKDT
jgi:hypothetical protein